MRAFIIQLANRPGGLADVAEAIAERGINITAVTGVTCGTDGAIGLITNDQAAAASLLSSRGIDHREIELVAAAIEDRPGTLADAARRLASAGVNIELLLPTGMEGNRVTVAFGVDNVEAAKSALGELATVGS
jgi:hypothetical protein